MPMPLRVADAFDGLAWPARERGFREARSIAAAARALARALRRAVGGRDPAPGRGRPTPLPRGGSRTPTPRRPGCASGRLFARREAPTADSPLAQLTTAERAVAERVADGLTSRRIAEELFISPRTVDAHLAHINRKLEINSRARLAALVIAEAG